MSRHRDRHRTPPKRGWGHRADPGLVAPDVGMFSLAFGISWLTARRRARRLRQDRIAKSVRHLRE